jgi:hypothetical protein
MNEWVQFFREFGIGTWGNICNIASFFIGVASFFIGVAAMFMNYHKKIALKDTELASLQKDVKAIKTSVEAVLLGSHESLEKRKAVESKKEDFWPTPEEDIAKRKSLMKKDTEQRDTALETMPQWSRAQVCGVYDVKGQNPVNKIEYKGELQIKERNEMLLGTWKYPTREIGASKPTDEGTGILVGNMLMFNFIHTDPQNPYTGVVTYQIMSDSFMRGLWTIGESNVGFEECQKKKPDE